MKDNLDIEKLFKDKFENFEGEVNPQVWSNLSAVVNGGAKVAAKTGMSVLTKALIIGGAAVVSGILIVGIVRSNDTSINAVTESTEPVVESTVLTEQDEPVVAAVIDQEKPEVITPNVVANNSDEPVVIDEPEVIEDMVVDHAIASGTDETEISSDESTHQEEEEATTIVAIEADDKNVINDSEEVQDGVSNTASNVKATAKVEFKQNETNCLEVEFKSNAENYKSLEWHMGDGTVSYDLEPVHLYNEYGEYTVILIVENHDGSTRSEIQTIQIVPISSIKVYNVFTPNNDNTNDYYSVETRNVESFSIAIYDFNNRLLFRSQDANFKWHGYDLKGNRVPKGDYYYGIIAEGKDGVVHKREGQLSIK